MSSPAQVISVTNNMNKTYVENEKNWKTQDVYSTYENEKDFLPLCKQKAETKYRNGIAQTCFTCNVHRKLNKYLVLLNI